MPTVVGSIPIEGSLLERLEKRAAIRRTIQSRKSVQEGKPDRLADLLEEAAAEIRWCYLQIDYANTHQ
jgi:hypothetical protein